MNRSAVSMPVTILPKKNKSGLKTGPGLSSIDLNYFAMYWDELYVPDNNLISVGLPNQESLISSGFLKRPMVNCGDIFGMPQMIDFLNGIQDNLIENLRVINKGTDFVIHNIGEDNFDSFIDKGNKIKSIRIELMNALPVPDSSVNIAEILNFKEKRQPEFEALHSLIQELYESVASSGDFDLARSQAFARLKLAMNDLNKTLFERITDISWFNLSFDNEFSIGDAWSAVQFTEGAYSASNGHLSSALLQIGSALVPQLMSKIKISSKNGKTGDYKRLKYLSKASSANLLKKKR